MHKIPLSHASMMMASNKQHHGNSDSDILSPDLEMTSLIRRPAHRMSAARFRAYSRSLASYSSAGSARSSYASSYGSYASSYATPSSYSSSYQPRSHSRYKRHKKPTDTKTMVIFVSLSIMQQRTKVSYQHSSLSSQIHIMFIKIS